MIASEIANAVLAFVGDAVAVEIAGMAAGDFPTVQRAVRVAVGVAEIADQDVRRLRDAEA